MSLRLDSELLLLRCQHLTILSSVACFVNTILPSAVCLKLKNPVRSRESEAEHLGVEKRRQQRGFTETTENVARGMQLKI